MSFHKTPKYQMPDLIAALKAHGLEHNKPSQLADAFRTGWVAAQSAQVPMTEPIWIVNDLGELGVKVGARFFFMYKGDNIEYGKDAGALTADGHTAHDDGTPMMYRPVGKREFGEVQYPDKWLRTGQSERRYTQELVFIEGLSFGKPEDGAWQPLPAAPDAPG